MLILWPHPRPPKSDLWRQGLAMCLTSPVEWDANKIRKQFRRINFPLYWNEVPLFCCQEIARCLCSSSRSCSWLQSFGIVFFLKSSSQYVAQPGIVPRSSESMPRVVPFHHSLPMGLYQSHNVHLRDIPWILTHHMRKLVAEWFSGLPKNQKEGSDARNIMTA